MKKTNRPELFPYPYPFRYPTPLLLNSSNSKTDQNSSSKSKNSILNLNKEFDPLLNLNHLQKSNLSLIFKSPLINKEKNKKIRKDNTLSSPAFPLKATGVLKIEENQENLNNFFKEKETLKKIFSNQIEKQRKFNYNVDNCLEYNPNLYNFEEFIFGCALDEGVKDEEVPISNCLTTFKGETLKNGLVSTGFTRFTSRSAFGLESGQGEKKYYYQLTLNINNYLFILSKFVKVSFFSHKSFIRKDTLFMPKRIFLKQPDVKYELMFRSIKKTLVQKAGPRFNFEEITPKPESIVETNVQTKKENLEVEILTPNQVTRAEMGMLTENLTFGVKNEKALELKSQRSKNIKDIDLKLLILEKKLITKLLKQGINLILNLNILIIKKKRTIKTIINLQNINNIEPALLIKLAIILLPSDGPLPVTPMNPVAPHLRKSTLNPKEGGVKMAQASSRKRFKIRSVPEPAADQGKTKNFKSKLELELKELENFALVPGPGAGQGENLRDKIQEQKKELGQLIVPGQGETKEGKCLWPRVKNEIFIPIPIPIPIKDKLEFETPELTNLPFSLLFYSNNKNKIDYPYNNNLQLKTIPFSLLLDKNTVLEGKNAVKLSIVNSHFDLDPWLDKKKGEAKNFTRDTIQTSVKSSTASISLALRSGAEKENSVYKPVISQYLKELSIYNIRNKGIIIFYYILIAFHFNTDLNKSFTSGKKTKNINKLLTTAFKSMYCLISKPVFITTPDKIIVQLFYYLFIPNVLKLKKFFKYKDKDKDKDKDNKLSNTYFNREPIVKNNDNGNLKSSPWPEAKAKSQSLAISKLRKKQKEISLRKKIFRKQYNKFRKIKINVRVKLRKLSNISLLKVFPNKFKLLSLILNNIFKKPVVFDLVRIHYPYNDSNILVNLLGIMINKIKLRIIIRRLFEKAIIKNINNLKEKRGIIIPSFLSGVTIRVAGRLLTHKVVPRLTVKTTSRGASASGRINFKDIATYTNKNKRGAYSITVKAGQNLF